MPIPNPKYPKERILDYWEASRKFLQEPKIFLQTLRGYDRDNIDPQIMRKIREKYITNKDFNPARVEKASNAAKGMCEWIIALDEYEKVLTIVRPKQEKYEESRLEVDRLSESLRKTREELAVLNKQIEDLEQQLESIRLKQKTLENDILDCEQKLVRAATLIQSLGSEQERWQQTAIELEHKLQYVVGDVCVSAGIVSYLGPFSLAFRNKSTKDWIEFAKKNQILVSENFSLETTLGEPIDIRKWVMNQLPSDGFSKENAIITYNTKRWPLMIDPQGQAHKWIILNEQFDGKKVTIVKQTDNNFLRNLENAIQFGQVLVIENTKEDIDSILDPVLSKQTFKSAGVLSIKLGDNIIDYSKNFKLYFTSKLRNPHFTPEISTRVTVLNFTITKEGLDDQLLELCVTKEEPDDQELRSKLIVQRHENLKQLDEIEKKILGVLNKAESILDDEQAVTILQNSKVLAQEIEEKQKYAEETESRINESRQNYKPIAQHSSVLFFTVMDMGNTNIMYQYSLDWFVTLYLDSFDKAKKSQEVEVRVQNVINYFTYSLFQNVCRSLFEKDKLVFTFLLLVRILESRHHLDLDEFRFFIQPVAAGIDQKETKTKQTVNTEESEINYNPCASWLEDTIWQKILMLSRLSNKFNKLVDSFQKSQDEWRKLYFDQNAHLTRFPEPFDTCSHLQRLCILKVFRPDKVVNSVQYFIQQELGDQFGNPPPFNLQLSYHDSNPAMPLVFILPGADPMVALSSFADSKNKYLKSISLGQGQGVYAEKAIEDAKINGSWVILQNCHLAPSWMMRLEKIVDDLLVLYQQQQNKVNVKDKLHIGFRLWLTTYSTPDFPNTILQNSIKMTNEPPKGVKSNLSVSYNSEQISDPNFFEGTQKSKQFKSLLYGLCLFHAVIQERRTFGPLGWNIQYDFNQSDLRISAKQLQIFISEYDNIPYKALHYLVGECNYGGRVTDDKDRRILNALMKDYFSEQILSPNFTFADCQQYTLPPVGTHSQYIKFIQSLPPDQPSQIFGFNENGQIVRDMKETADLCGSLLQMWTTNPNMSDFAALDDALSVSDKQDQQLKQICEELLGKFPRKFDLEIAEAKYPLDYNNSMNSVLQQEIVKYNNLLTVITKSLRDIILSLQGIVLMSETLENVSNSLMKGLVPNLWLKNSYPSLKPLSGYVSDLLRRLQHYHHWVEVTPPKIHWISGFYFTQAFLTATLQNFARKYTIPIDALNFSFEFYSEPQLENIEDQATIIDIKDGYLMYGLFIEGCKWDYPNQRLVESDQKILFTNAPIIWLKPVESNKFREEVAYQCPVYKTAERRGILSTTGHSTNFIMFISMPTERNVSHWVKRGVAMLCQLTD